MLQQERTEHLPADSRTEIERLEQLATAELRGNVVHPDPEAILDPLQIGKGIARRAGRQRVYDAIVARPKDHRILDPHRQSVREDELEVDVHRGWPVETDQKAGLAHVLA